jgi:hypothetical protein
MENFRNIYGRVTQILGFVMIVVYITLGVVLLTVPGFYADFNGVTRYMLGVLLILYAGYRGYRVVYSNKI